MTDQIHLRQRSPWTAIPKVADRPNRTAVRQMSPWTAIPKVADRPNRTAVRQWPPWTAIRKVATARIALRSVWTSQVVGVF